MKDFSLLDQVERDSYEAWQRIQARKKKEKRKKSRDAYHRRQEALGLLWACYNVPVEYVDYFKDIVKRVMDKDKIERATKRDYLKVLNRMSYDD